MFDDRFDGALVVRASWIALLAVLGLILGQTRAQSMFGGPGMSGMSGMSGAAPRPRSDWPVPPRSDGPRYKPPGDGVPVREVRITGLRSVPEVKARSFVQTRNGRAFDPERVEDDVRRLVSSGLFRDVRTYTQKAPGGISVIFEVFERPTIGYFKIVGNGSISDKALTKQTDLKVGDALGFYAVEQARSKVEEFYRKKGFTGAQVSILEGNRVGDLGVVLLVNEGVKQRIWDVHFVGNTIASDSRLKTQIQSKPGLLKYLFKGEVDRRKIDEDVERLTAYYRGLGYYRARVGRDFKFGPSRRWMTLIFVIDEGPRYKIQNVSFVGNRRFTDAELARDLRLKSSDYFNLAAMNRDVRTLRDMYGSRGHIFADIQAEPRLYEEAGKLDLVYQIKEGQQYRVGNIFVHIDGPNPHTRRSVVLNSLDFQPGDIIDSRKIRSSERRLKSRQLFRNEPASGVSPRIVILPPKLDDKAGAVAERPQYRGQSPDRDVHVYYDSMENPK